MQAEKMSFYILFHVDADRLPSPLQAHQLLESEITTWN